MGRGRCVPSLWTTRALETGALASLTAIGRLRGASSHTTLLSLLCGVPVCTHTCVCGCVHACLCWHVERGGVSGEGPSGPPAPRLPSPGPAPPWMAGVEQGFRNSQGRGLAAGKGQERLSVPGGGALVTQSESVSGPQPHCGPGGGGSGVRGRGWLSRKARFHLLLRGCRLRQQEPERTARKSPAGQGPGRAWRGSRRSGGDYSAPESCSRAPLLPRDLSPSLVAEAGLAAGRGRGVGASPFAALPTPRCPS